MKDIIELAQDDADKAYEALDHLAEICGEMLTEIEEAGDICERWQALAIGWEELYRRVRP